MKSQDRIRDIATRSFQQRPTPQKEEKNVNKTIKKSLHITKSVFRFKFNAAAQRARLSSPSTSAAAAAAANVCLAVFRSS